MDQARPVRQLPTLDQPLHLGPVRFGLEPAGLYLTQDDCYWLAMAARSLVGQGAGPCEPLLRLLHGHALSALSEPAAAQLRIGEPPATPSAAAGRRP